MFLGQREGERGRSALPVQRRAEGRSRKKGDDNENGRAQEGENCGREKSEENKTYLKTFKLDS